MDTTVNASPCLPTCTAACAFMPNPSPITENCNSLWVKFLVWVVNGLPTVWASARPSASATGGEAHGVRQYSSNSPNTTCRPVNSRPHSACGA